MTTFLTQRRLQLILEKNNLLRLPGRAWAVRLAVVVGALALSVPAFAGFTINPTFTRNFNADFGANAVAAQNAWRAAANVFTSNFSDNIQVNITVDAVADTSVFGQSNWGTVNNTWAGLRAAVVGDAKTADDNTSIGAGGSLPVADPAGNGNWYVTRAEAKALGIIASDGANDGITRFGAGYSWTFNGGPPAAGTYDFTGVAEHEIAEVLGRIGFGGEQNSYTLLDAFSFRGATRVLGDGGGLGAGSFSIDRGTTLLNRFNDHFNLGFDYRDWESANPSTPGDAFNQFSNGAFNPVSQTDLREMDVIGYDRVTTPEPSSLLLLACGLGIGGFIRRRVKS
jgi:hypothetical protein